MDYTIAVIENHQDDDPITDELLDAAVIKDAADWVHDPTGKIIVRDKDGTTLATFADVATTSIHKRFKAARPKAN